MRLRDFLGYPKPPTGFAELPQQFTYLDPKNITYPAVAVIGGVFLNFLVNNVTGAGPRIWVALIIALVFGGFILSQGLADKNNSQSRGSQVFVCLINTFMLWVVIFSVAAVPVTAITGQSPSGG